MGAIDELALDDLHLVLNIAKHIHAKTVPGSREEASAELAVYFPTFLWVLRDFHLKLVDAKGKPVTERDYLESALRTTPGQEKQNKLRQMVKDLFPERDCHTIVRPCSDEEDLRNVQRLPYESLRPQFQSQVEEFTRKVYRSLQPKRIDGAEVSGAMLVNLAEEYCRAINKSAVPTIQATWTYVVQSQLRKSTKDGVHVYRAYMNDKVMTRLPMNEDRLRNFHKAAKAEAMQIFLAPSINENDANFREYRTEFSKRIKQLYDHALAENAAMSQQQCQVYAEELWRNQIESKLNIKGSYANVEQLMKDWEELQRTFIERTQGPAQVDVLSGVLFQRMKESVQRIGDDRTAQRTSKSSKDEGARHCNLSNLMGIFTGGSAGSSD